MLIMQMYCAILAAPVILSMKAMREARAESGSIRRYVLACLINCYKRQCGNSPTLRYKMQRYSKGSTDSKREQPVMK